jgi:hypothetical protein
MNPAAANPFDAEGDNLGPEHFHPSLAGCTWTKMPNAFALKDERGALLGMGASKASAALLSLRVRQAASMQPEAYYDCLAGCQFGSKARRGDVNWTTVVDAAGQIVACAATRADAALTAARHVLRNRPTETLAIEDFRRICTVITVEEARGKSGKAKTGEPYLKMEYRTDPEAGARFRALLLRLVDETTGLADVDGLPASQAYDARARAAARLGEQLLEDNYFDGAMKPVALGNGEWLVLRRPDAPAARQCAQDALDAIASGELLTEEDAEPAHERARMR